MQVTERIHAVRLPFTLALPGGQVLERFVYAYLICGGRICLIDAGVAASREAIFGYLSAIGREPAEISHLVLTHAHPDHIGAAAAIRAETGCTVTAHRDAIPWIEDTQRQFRERPVPSFHEIVGGPTPVDAGVEDGDTVELGADGALSVIETPGHSRGHIALHSAQDRALFCGDTVPVPGQMPVYEDVALLVRSLERLLGVVPVEVLLSSWDEPRRGEAARGAVGAGLAAVRELHALVMRVSEQSGSEDPIRVAAGVVHALGLPEAALNAVVVASIAAHLRAADTEELADMA
ncbi:MAG: MBL fold metallo-hydrolase [Armatimonadota bacterium]